MWNGDRIFTEYQSSYGNGRVSAGRRDHTFFVAENEKNQVIGILQIMFKHVEGPSHTTRVYFGPDGCGRSIPESRLLDIKCLIF